MDMWSLGVTLLFVHTGWDLAAHLFRDEEEGDREELLRHFYCSKTDVEIQDAIDDTLEAVLGSNEDSKDDDEDEEEEEDVRNRLCVKDLIGKLLVVSTRSGMVRGQGSMEDQVDLLVSEGSQAELRLFMKQLLRLGMRQRLGMAEVLAHPYVKTPTGTTTLTSADVREATRRMFELSEGLFGSNEAVVAAIGNLRQRMDSEQRSGVPSVDLEQFQVRTAQELRGLQDQLQAIFDRVSEQRN